MEILCSFYHDFAMRFIVFLATALLDDGIGIPGSLRSLFFIISDAMVMEVFEGFNYSDVTINRSSSTYSFVMRVIDSVDCVGICW